VSDINRERELKGEGEREGVKEGRERREREGRGERSEREWIVWLCWVNSLFMLDKRDRGKEGGR
jgi:hypothetical protein